MSATASTTSATGDDVHPFTLEVPRSSSPTYAAASPPPSGPTGKLRLGLAEGDPRYLGFEHELSEHPTIAVPTIAIAGGFDGPNPDRTAYADRFTGPSQHRILNGIGHNVPQETPTAFVEAVLELARQEAAHPRS